jgi:hypothetical protein
MRTAATSARDRDVASRSSIEGKFGLQPKLAASARSDDATRIALVLLAQVVDWRAVLTIV